MIHDESETTHSALKACNALVKLLIVRFRYLPTFITLKYFDLAANYLMAKLAAEKLYDC